MQIVQTLNDFIKILYSPGMESICLGDFILVQEAAQRFLGQVVEISDDRFDDSKNIAQIKLTHSINEKGEIIDFNYHLPSKQCDILYANRREILDFINENKKVIPLGKDYKFSKPFEMNVDFFNNNALIFCDKIKEHNSISPKLAKKLSEIKNSIIFDYTGSLEIPGAQRFCAVIDFKLPLDYYSLDYIWEKGLNNAALETQAICGEIFNEVKNYARVTKDKFIPYRQFVKVVNAQYKATPIKELLVLKNRLQKYQQEEIFANTKAEFTNVFKNLNKEKITIIDLSKLKTFWHKDFTECVLRNIGINVFVFLRLNEQNFDSNLVQLLYNKNKKITPIPSVSHGFAKLPAISEHCHNYIIMPSTSHKKDFGYINNTIASMSTCSILLYGQETKNFALLIKNLDGKEEQEKKLVKKITFEGDVIKNMRVKDKLTQLNQKKMREIEQDVDQFLSGSIKLPPKPPEVEIEVQEFVPSIKEAKKAPKEVFPAEEIISEEELDFIDSLVQGDKTETEEEIAAEENILIENNEVGPPIEEIEISEGKMFETEESDEFVLEEPISEELEEFPAIEEFMEPPAEEVTLEEEGLGEEIVEETMDELLGVAEYNEFKEEITAEENVEAPLFENKDLIQEESFETIEDFSLEDLANESIETAFDELVEEKQEVQIEEQSVQELIKEPIIEEESPVFSKEFIEDIPIFTPTKTETNKSEKYQEGDSVSHEKYGNGKVLQVVEYADKVLLQIEFKQIGKRLLDPIAANLRKI